MISYGGRAEPVCRLGAVLFAKRMTMEKTGRQKRMAQSRFLAHHEPLEPFRIACSS